MALQVKNSSGLITPKDYKLKILVFGPYGVGKTTFLSTFPNILVGAAETGHGKGLMSVAGRKLDYAEINNYTELEEFCEGSILKPYDSVGLDSLSEVVRTSIKEKALKIPRTRGESAKRLMGIPELDDYGTMGELTRKLVRKLLDVDKHVVMTAGMRIDKPDESNPTGETLIGPDLAGQMFLGSTAMFDLVLFLRTRTVLRDPKDAKSRYVQRYFVTDNGGSGILAKNRMSVDSRKSFLPTEVVFDPETGSGTFEYFHKLATDAYTKWTAEQQPK